MLRNFRTFELAVQLHRECRNKALPAYLKDQLLRASSSIALNLSEGSARSTQKDRHRFYIIAFASCREVQTIIELDDGLNSLRNPADALAAHLYKLTRSTG
jgi:four helix bundle protein